MKISLFFFIILSRSSTTDIINGKVHRPTEKSLENGYKKIIFNVPYAEDNAFTIAQIHTYKNKSLFSYSYPPVYGESHYGNHHGLFQRLYPSTKKTTFYDSLRDTSVKQSFFAVYYDINSPIPGACCQTCALETDPNIEIMYNKFTTTVRFHRASVFYTSSNIPSCDTSAHPLTFRLRYKFYYKFLRLHDFSEDDLFDGIKKMADPNEIDDYGYELSTLYGGETLSFSFETARGYATIFNIIVSDPGTGKSSAYIPTVSYGCNTSIPLDKECTKHGSTTTLVFSVILAVFGLSICFIGLKIYPFIVFLSGFLLSWLIIFTLMGRYVPDGKNDIDEITVISACCSIVGGAACLFLHAFSKFRYFCYIIVTLCFGVFISSVVFYTPFRYFDIWNVDYRFLLGFLSFTLGIALICLFFPRITVYLFSSILGTYGILLLPNYFIYGNMQYIIVTVLLRMTVYDFGTSFLRRPYQREEYILTGAWVASAIFCFLVHYFLTRKDEFEISGSKMREKTWLTFSQSFKKVRKNRRRRYKSATNPTTVSNETSPLLSDNRQYNPYYNSNANPTLSSFGQQHVTRVDVHNPPPTAPPTVTSEPTTMPSAPPTYEESESAAMVI